MQRCLKAICKCLSFPTPNTRRKPPKGVSQKNYQLLDNDSFQNNQSQRISFVKPYSDKNDKSPDDVCHQNAQPRLCRLIKPCPKKTYSLSNSASLKKLKKQRLHVHNLELNIKNYSSLKTKKLLRNFKGLTQIKVKSTKREQLEKFFELYQKNSVRNLVIPIITPIRDFFPLMKSAKEFVHRKNSSMTLYTWDFTTADYSKLLNFLLINYANPRRSIGLKGIVYRFHEKVNSAQLQTLTLAYLSKAITGIREITIPLEVNSTNLFVDWRVENWKKFAELIAKRRGYPEPLKTNLKIKFNNGVLEETLKSMIEQMSCLLHLLFGDQSKERENDVVELDIEIDCNKNLHSLDEFIDKVLMPISKVNRMRCEVDKSLPLKYYEEVLVLFDRLEKKNKIVMEGNVKKIAGYHKDTVSWHDHETISYNQYLIRKSSTSSRSRWY